MKRIMRIIIPLSIFLVVCVGSQPVQAGVVVDSNGIVTEFTETTYSQNTYYFYEGSYDSTSSTSVTISDADTLSNFSEGPGCRLESVPRSVSLDTTVSYVMASNTVNTTVTVHEVIKDSESADWLTRSNAFYRTSATNNGSQTFILGIADRTDRRPDRLRPRTQHRYRNGIVRHRWIRWQSSTSSVSSSHWRLSKNRVRKPHPDFHRDAALLFV